MSKSEKELNGILVNNFINYNWTAFDNKELISILKFIDNICNKQSIKQSIDDFLYLIDYEFIFDENSSYEEQANRDYFELCSKYNLKRYEEYTKEELSIAIFGNYEE